MLISGCIVQVQESLFLFDEQRLSVLYVPSGKTRRKVPKLTPMLANVAVLTHTDNGTYSIRELAYSVKDQQNVCNAVLVQIV